MLSNKRLNKHYKKAQQIVELALVLPFFIICFSFVFQLMVETYAKYKFSYIFTNSIARAVEEQQNTIRTTPILNLAQMGEYNFQNEVTEITEESMTGVPNNGIQISSLRTNGINNYISGVFITDVQRIFFSTSGLEYFYFIIPINRIYFRTMVLNVAEEDFRFFSEWYFPTFQLLYTREMERMPGGAGGAGGAGGGTTPPDPTDPAEPEAEPPEAEPEPAGFGGGSPVWGEAEIGG